MGKLLALEWPAIIIACVVSVVASAVIGFAWGFVAMALYVSRREDAIAWMSGEVLGVGIGFLLSLIAVVIGASYLARRVWEQRREHCLVFGVVTLALNVAIAFAFGESGFTWDQIVYCAAIVPAALLGGEVGLILRARPGGWRPRKATVDALFRLLDDPAPGVRKNALDALEVIAPREVLESALAKMLNDADEHNRDAARQVQEELRKREK